MGVLTIWVMGIEGIRDGQMNEKGERAGGVGEERRNGCVAAVGCLGRREAYTASPRESTSRPRRRNPNWQWWSSAWR